MSEGDAPRGPPGSGNRILPPAPLGARARLPVSCPKKLFPSLPRRMFNTMNDRTAARVEPPCETPPAAGALAQVFASCERELLGTLYCLVGNCEDARDALQETFLKCWRHRGEVAEVRNVRAWVFQIALNTGRDLRQTAWRRKRKALPDEEAMLVSQHDGPAIEAQHRERIARLRAALVELRPEEQEIFLLRQNGDLTYDEIGQTLGVPTGTVKTRMRLAIARLREVLADAT